jgi:transcriptional regulator with XRE-family HTH domain
MSPGQRSQDGLGDFLKARRAQLTPHAVGLPEAGTRREVAGLRREEVAQLAAISVDYLTRLEQGRVRASASVLSTLSRALRLDEDQQAYLYELAGQAPRPRRRPAQQARPAMRRLLDQLTDTRVVVLGRRLDILAWNAGATAARDPDDPDLAVLVGELSVQDADFRTWWAIHQVTRAGYGTKHYRHPPVGDLTLDCDTWDSPDGSGQRLMVLTAEPGTPFHERLRILASWNAEPDTGLYTERPSGKHDA